MNNPKRTCAGRVFLLFAFLLAQQSAFAHQIWHAAGTADKSSQSSKLCEQHAALGTVLGALNGCAALALFADQAPEHLDGFHSPVASTPSLPPASRGPPALPGSEVAAARPPLSNVRARFVLRGRHHASQLM